MKTTWIVAAVCLAAGTARGAGLQTPSLTPDFEPFATQAASEAAGELDLVECCRICRQKAAGGALKPWSFALTQTADFGTSLALPIGLTPSNTLLSPIGDASQAAILTGSQAQLLGILGNLGILPVPPGTDVQGVFEDDFQFQTTAATSYQRELGEFGVLTAGYSYYQNLHPDLDELDLQSHTPTVQHAIQLTDRITLTNYYTYSYYFLSGSSFVSQNRIGSTAVLRANDRWDFGLGTNYANANFRGGSQFLNSDNYAGTLEATRYLDEGRNNYIKAGYGAGYSDAVLSGFAYQLNSVFTVIRFLYGNEFRNEVRLSGGYGRYDFIGVDPIQSTIFRADNIYNAGLFYGRKIGDNWQVFAQYSYLKSNSNVARQLYNSDLISLGVTYAR
ncbi:MAG: hypothetical protein JNK76_15100 [Planctomycetales bacterium]|nr:hypothetical protein [Planctomycetales bacterium]MBN8628111.1 hypothetical protein [Planctomycetota bacterium]